VTCGAGGRFYQVKANGMVRDVFDTQGIKGLKGWMGVGHGESSLSIAKQVVRNVEEKREHRGGNERK
jgi:glutamine phosphoribosylpyrophosphate amidotransferase